MIPRSATLTLRRSASSERRAILSSCESVEMGTMIVGFWAPVAGYWPDGGSLEERSDPGAAKIGGDTGSAAEHA